MTNTIPNVPRELLEELRDAANEGMNATTRQHQIDYFAGLIAKADALLSAPSPAGVDGLGNTAKLLLPALRQYMHSDGSGLLAGYDLETTQAVIDGLRAEVGAQRAKTCAALKARNDAHEERDHLAQCLKFARTTMAVVANNANLRGVEYRSLVTEVKRIDAALAAVCAAAPNIATTSEHSGS